MPPALLSIPMRYFLEVARTGSVNQAAARLFVASSAVSRQVAKLEDGIGTALFQRRRSGMELTEAGLRLAGHLNATLSDADFVMEQVKELGRQAAGRVRVCCAEGLVSGFMPNVMRGYREAQPATQVELMVVAPDEMRPLVLSGDADIAIKFATAPEPGMRVEHATPSPVLVVMSPDHPLARMRSVRVVDVVAYPLLLGAPGGSARMLFDMACAAQGVQYRPAFSSNVSSIMLPILQAPDLLLAGQITVAHLIESQAVVARPFSDAILDQRSLQVLSLEGRTLSPPARLFVQHVEKATQSLARRRLGRALRR